MVKTWGEFLKLSKADQIAQNIAWMESRMQGGVLRIDDKDADPVVDLDLLEAATNYEDWWSDSRHGGR
jgi:hypothetical protein